MKKDKDILREFIKNELLNKKGLMSSTGILKKGYKYLADKFGCTQAIVKEIVEDIRKEQKQVEYAFVVTKIEEQKKTAKFNINKLENNNRLVIADLHAPFILDGYLDFCNDLKKQYNCTKVSFTGDIIDAHSWSYHEVDPDGMGVGDEIYAAKKQLKTAYQMFSNAEITLGNHDLLIARKARTAGLSRYFIKDLGEILEAPKGWNFSHEFIHNNVRYIHGSVGNAFTRAKDSRMSTVQGHLHSQAFIQYSVSEKDAIFGLQLGAGIDRDKYAFEYAKPMTQKPVISAGLVLENGTLPILRLMKL